MMQFEKAQRSSFEAERQLSMNSMLDYVDSVQGCQQDLEAVFITEDHKDLDVLVEKMGYSHRVMLHLLWEHKKQDNFAWTCFLKTSRKAIKKQFGNKMSSVINEANSLSKFN